MNDFVVCGEERAVPIDNDAVVDKFHRISGLPKAVDCLAE